MSTRVDISLVEKTTLSRQGNIGLAGITLTRIVRFLIAQALALVHRKRLQAMLDMRRSSIKALQRTFFCVIAASISIVTGNVLL